MDISGPADASKNDWGDLKEAKLWEGWVAFLICVYMWLFHVVSKLFKHVVCLFLCCQCVGVRIYEAALSASMHSLIVHPIFGVGGGSGNVTCGSARGIFYQKFATDLRAVQESHEKHMSLLLGGAKRNSTHEK